MFQPTFHLNGFKPWIPPRANAHSSHKLHKVLNPLRYPTPVSVSSSPPPSNPPQKNGPSALLPVQNSKHHPLPARPPTEVCVSSNARSCTPRSSQPPTSNRSTSVSNSFHMTDFLCRTTTSPVLENGSYSTSTQNLRGDIGYATADAPIELPSLQATMDDPSSPSVSSLEDSLEEFFGSPNAHTTVPVDPEILADGEPWKASELHHVQQHGGQSADETASAYPEPPPILRDVPDHHRNSTDGQTNSEDCVPHMIGPPLSQEDHMPIHLIDHGYDADIIRLDAQDQSSCGNEAPKSRKRPSSKRQRAEKSSKRPRTATTSGAREHSFASFRSHFLSLPCEDRLQFLSWLFEGVLPRCMIDCENTTHIEPPIGEPQVAAPSHPRGAATKPDESIIGQGSSRKGMPWLPEEKTLLVELKRERKLPWSDVTRVFSEQFPGRSRGSIQVYWSTHLKDSQG